MTTATPMVSNQWLVDLAFLSKILDYIDGDTFTTDEGRITVQRKIYLAQLFGIKLGYTFQRNLFGPYSRALSDDCELLQSHLREAREIAEPLKLTADAKKGVERVRKLFAVPAELNIDQALWLELLSTYHIAASLLFPKTELKALQEDELAAIEDKLMGDKPYLSGLRQQLRIVWDALIGK